jgi:hypothetical protein
MGNRKDRQRQAAADGLNGHRVSRRPNIDASGYGDCPDPEPLGTAGRWWVMEVHEIEPGTDRHTLTFGGHFPHGAVPAAWRARWWMAAARAAHDMAMRCQAEAYREEQHSR